MPRWPQRYADLASAATAVTRGVVGHTATALAGVERWLLPASCLLCAEPVAPADDEPLVCALCRLRWRPVPHPICDRCGQPANDAAECLLCREWPTGLTRVRSAVWLDGGAREAAHRLKYDGWWRVADSMADAMRHLAPLTGRVSLVPTIPSAVPSIPPALSAAVPRLVPIPLGARRRRVRGYNQSERIASALGVRLGLPVHEAILTRVRDTGTQTALTPEARRANVAGAFRADLTELPAGGATARFVLVDDVFTTGATLVAAAAALIDAGAAEVEAVTFARAATPIMNL